MNPIDTDTETEIEKFQHHTCLIFFQIKLVNINASDVVDGRPGANLKKNYFFSSG
jgi:hypothetical protein